MDTKTMELEQLKLRWKEVDDRCTALSAELLERKADRQDCMEALQNHMVLQDIDTVEICDGVTLQRNREHCVITRERKRRKKTPSN